MVNLMIKLNNVSFKSKNEAKAKLCINDFNEICKNLLMNENKHKQPNNTQRAQNTCKHFVTFHQTNISQHLGCLDVALRMDIMNTKYGNKTNRMTS